MEVVRCGAPARWSLARVLAQRYAAPAFAALIVRRGTQPDPHPQQNQTTTTTTTSAAVRPSIGAWVWRNFWADVGEAEDLVASFCLPFMSVEKRRFSVRVASILLAAASALQTLPCPLWWKLSTLATILAIVLVQLS